jgi:hypothetical protein
VELFLMAAGLCAAVVVGVAWALHRHELAENADKVSQWSVGAAFFLAMGELQQEWTDWQHERLIPHGRFLPDGTYVTDPPPPTPHFLQELGHVVGQMFLELARDLAVAGVTFGIAMLVIRLTRDRRETVDG